MNDRPLYLHEYRPISKLTVERHPIRKPRFPVIDVHGHFADLYLPLYAERSEEWIPADVESLVAVLRQQGIRNIVNLDGFWDGFMGLDLQTVIEATRDYPDFFINFVSVDTTRIGEPDFADRVRRHLTRAYSLGFRGIKLFKHVSLMVEERPYVYRPGRGVRIDDPRLDVIWQTAARLDWPVLVHIADPECFFDPVDAHNERYLELLAHPDWAYAGSGTYSFAELMLAQENLLGNNPETTFIIPHVGSNAENLGFVSGLLHRHANLYVDLAARINELGRQYHTAHRFFLEHADRILFGTDVYTRTAAWCYEPYYTYLETCDDAIGGSSWTMTGQGLPDAVLEQIYWKNATRILGLSGC
ncbi:MAG: amidohydrolase family protein [Bacillota bacterium]|nr:amidohydrolase family protein [Bacillota bacterium]